MNYKDIPASITLCEDGKYRWVYELKMFRNPAVFLTVFKVLAISSLLPFMIVVIADGFKNFTSSLKVFLIILGIMFILCMIGYTVTAVLFKGRYCVVFTMDEDRITHAQQEKQYRKAQLAGIITAMAGAAAGKPGPAGTGLLAASRSELTSDFSTVKSIKVFPRQNMIRLDAPLSHNQIYCDDDAMEFVEKFIREKCAKAK